MLEEMTRAGTWQLNLQAFANFWTKNCCWIVCSLSLWFGSRRGSFHFYLTSPEPPAELSDSTVAEVKSFFPLWKIIQNMTEHLEFSASAFLVYSLTYKGWTNWKLQSFPDDEELKSTVFLIIEWRHPVTKSTSHLLCLSSRGLLDSRTLTCIFQTWSLAQSSRITKNDSVSTESHGAKIHILELQ